MAQHAARTSRWKIVGLLAVALGYVGLTLGLGSAIAIHLITPNL